MASPTVWGEGQCVLVLNGLCEDDITQYLTGRQFFFTSSLELRRQRGDWTSYSGSLRTWWTGPVSYGWPGRHHQVLRKHHGSVVKTNDMLLGLREHTGWSGQGLVWRPFVEVLHSVGKAIGHTFSGFPHQHQVWGQIKRLSDCPFSLLGRCTIN